MESVATVDVEEVRVQAWVLERLRDLGFAPHLAVQLAAAEVDWHYADHLIRDLGYTHEQAVRLIL